MAMKQVPVVALLDVYPKRGPMQQLSIEDKEVLRLSQEFLKEMTDGTILQHDVENLLTII